ncbi:MAG: hypothetical protein HFJ54_00790 [Clostridia bacterium]|nr:hypothetical protein [Clostridia bacterium]
MKKFMEQMRKFAKRDSFFIFCILVIVGIAACIRINLDATRIQNLEGQNRLLIQENSDAADEIGDLEEQLEALKAKPVEVTSAEVTETRSYTLAELTEMVRSEDLSDVAKVAQSEEASESLLLFAAARCVNEYSVENESAVFSIASALISNSKSTSAVSTTLARCSYPSVLLLVAESPKASSATLLLLTEACINDSRINSAGFQAITAAIIENSAITEDILQMFLDSNNYDLQLIAQNKLTELNSNS